MTKVAKSTLEEVDLILWLVEPSTYIGEVEKSIIEELKKSKKPIILVINKIDTVSAENLQKFEDAYTKEMDFARVVKVAALKGQNVDGVLATIKEFLPYGPALYDEDTITDQPERQIIAEIIREKSLHALRDEIPHGIAVTVESMKERKGKPIVDIEATIICEKDSHKGIIIGKKGAALNAVQIAEYLIACGDLK